MPPDRALIWLSIYAPEIPDLGGCHKTYTIDANDDVPLASSPYSEMSVGVADLRWLSDSALQDINRWVEFLALRHWVAIINEHPAPGSDVHWFIARYCSDFHSAPLDLKRFSASLGHFWGMTELQLQAASGQYDAGNGPDFNDIALTGSSPAICATRTLLRRFASVNEPVLINGESGSGKEAAARFIHNHSSRANGPLVVINCAALPESLTQSELFGYERGAFTSAIKAHPGRLEGAHRGTVLLAGIDELSLKQQSSLLPFLQEGLVERIGSNTPCFVDARVLATSSKELGEQVRQGEFRGDVYYRLGSLTVTTPALRQRSQDIVTLAQQLLDQHKTFQKLSAEAVMALAHHTWPGNLRELQNRLRQAALLSDSADLSSQHLGLQDALPNATNPSQLTLAAFRNEAERHALSCSLGLTQQNVSAAARMLKISRVSFYRLLEKHNNTALPSRSEPEGDRL